MCNVKSLPGAALVTPLESGKTTPRKIAAEFSGSLALVSEGRAIVPPRCDPRRRLPRQAWKDLVRHADQTMPQLPKRA